MADEPLIAVFVDFENLAIGVRDMKGHVEFELVLVLKRLLEKGRIVSKRAYCDWSQYRNAMNEFHRHGVEMIDIPRSKVSGKNSADIRMVVDALDLCYSKSHIDTFALLTGDSDFSPLVSKLKENEKNVIGCGVKNSTSDLLIANCDEFIYYDNLVVAKREPRKAASTGSGPTKKTPVKSDDKKQDAMDRLVDVISSLRHDYDPLWGSLIKQTIRRVYPDFNETYHGYRSFRDLLEDAEKRGLIHLEHDPDRGNFKVGLRES